MQIHRICLRQIMKGRFHPDMPVSLDKAGRHMYIFDKGSFNLFPDHRAGNTAVGHIIVGHMQGAFFRKAVVRYDFQPVRTGGHIPDQGGKCRVGIVMLCDTLSVQQHGGRMADTLADNTQISLSHKRRRITALSPVLSKVGIILPAAGSGDLIIPPGVLALKGSELP